MYYVIYFLSRPIPVQDMVVFPGILEEVRENQFGYWTGKFRSEGDSILPACTAGLKKTLRQYKTISGCHCSARKIMAKYGAPRIADYRIAIINDQ